MTPEEFREELREKLNQDPANPDLHFSYGGALAESGHFDDAATEYQRALKHKPDWPEALNNLGVVYLEQGRLSDAAALFDEIARVDPHNTAAHNNLGLIRAEQNSLMEAAACFRKALESDPNHQKARANLERVLDDSGYYFGELEAVLFPPKLAAPPAVETEPAPKTAARNDKTSLKRSPRGEREKSSADGGHIAGLLKYLKDLTGALPETKQDVFLKSDARLSMEFIIGAMEGKKGLFREIREKIPEAETAASLPPEAGPKITETLSYLGNLMTTLPDDELGYVLKQKVENIMTLIQSGEKEYGT